MRLRQIGLSLTALFCLLGFSVQGAHGQEQAVFQDERQMEMDNAHQANQLQQQEQQYAQTVKTQDAKDETYRLYADKRVGQLLRLRDAGGSPSRSYASQTGELKNLQTWLKADANTRKSEAEHIKSLDEAISNLRDSAKMASSNMQGDIEAMNQDRINAHADDTFNHMMQINQFNELQSEMGAASWGRPPTDGTFNSTGGYGMGGGYGYSPFMGRRW